MFSVAYGFFFFIVGTDLCALTIMWWDWKCGDIQHSVVRYRIYFMNATGSVKYFYMCYTWYKHPCLVSEINAISYNSLPSFNSYLSFKCQQILNQNNMINNWFYPSLCLYLNLPEFFWSLGCFSFLRKFDQTQKNIKGWYIVSQTSLVQRMCKNLHVVPVLFLE